MTEHLTFDQLCDLADGATSASEAELAHAHLRACADCASRAASLSALGAATAALPREIAPPADLWDDIRAEIAPRRATRQIGQRWSRSNLLAAGLVIAVASSALTALALRTRAPSTGAVTTPAVATTGPAAPELPATLALAEYRYSRSADALQRTLAERRDSLAPSTLATVERSLRVADSAIAEARAALAQDPGNHALEKLYSSNYERKIDLLRRATALDPRT